MHNKWVYQFFTKAGNHIGSGWEVIYLHFLGTLVQWYEKQANKKAKQKILDNDNENPKFFDKWIW